MFRFKLLSSLKASLLCLYLAIMSVGGAVVPAVPTPSQPEWVRGGTHARFNRITHLTAVGSGNSRHAAERDALGRLVSIFGQAVHFDETTTELYWGVMGSGAAAIWGERIYIESYFERRAGMDDLVGAEIGDFWEDGRGTSFALAVLNRARATQIYSGRIRANQEIIDNLTNMSWTERNTFDGLARYHLAAVFADMNVGYGEILSIIGAPQYARGLSRGDNFRREAQEIRGAIQIDINVKSGNARTDARIRSAFADVLFNEMGFLTGGTNHRYMLDVNLTMQPYLRRGLGREWIDVSVDVHANLVYTSTGVILLPHFFNYIGQGRTQTNAENIAINGIVRMIHREYGSRLSQLAPRR